MRVKLNNEVGIDLSKLIESRLLVQANSGGGKSWAIRRIVEQAFGHVQVIILDPEGEFTNLREHFDFVFAGKGGDAPAEPRSASMLARRLLELKASAIVDLYELTPQERKHFVRLFCEAMVNAPKELWHDCLVIIDEAHVFAPEKGESEAMGPVIDLATRGRKRGYCVVLATQRLPKLAKDAAAECNNKLIGRASQDIDRKRAAEELGFTSREQILSLRDLEPGEFYVFGPAISRDVTKIRIGDVQVKPPKRGERKSTPPPPTARVKTILAKLADLPKEAQHEATTVAALKKQLADARRELSLSVNKAGAPAVKVERIEVPAVGKRALEGIKKSEAAMRRMLSAIKEAVSVIEAGLNKLSSEMSRVTTTPVPPQRAAPAIVSRAAVLQRPISTVADASIGAGERKVLIAIAHNHDGMTRQHITVHTGYKRSTRDAYILRLHQKGYVSLGDKIVATAEGVDALGADYQPLPTGAELVDHLRQRLPSGEWKVLKLLLERPDGIDREEITEITGYQRSTRDAYILRLAARELVETSGPGRVRASALLV